MIAVIVINYRRTSDTLQCLASLYETHEPFDLYLVDNASDVASQNVFEAFARERGNVILLCNRENRGFAAGCNQALEQILAGPEARYQAVVLLNNDTVVSRGWLDKMRAALDPGSRQDMVAAPMLHYGEPEEVDSLGIVLYRSGIASNRRQRSDPLLGPCGGAALYSVALLRTLRERTGEWFDETFFCYAEDSDIALRARALGFQCAFAEEALVYHKGASSSGGAGNDFIAFYGLRNSLFMIFKNLPGLLLLRYGGWILLMQVAVVVKYVVKGRPGLLWRIYRDFAQHLPQIRLKRRRLEAFREVDLRTLNALIAPRFYDRSYVLQALSRLHRRDIRPAQL